MEREKVIATIGIGIGMFIAGFLSASLYTKLVPEKEESKSITISAKPFPPIEKLHEKSNSITISEKPSPPIEKLHEKSKSGVGGLSNKEVLFNKELITYLVYRTEVNGKFVLPLLERKFNTLLEDAKKENCLPQQVQNRIQFFIKRYFGEAKKLWKELRPEIEKLKQKLKITPPNEKIELNRNFVEKMTFFQDFVDILTLEIIILPDELKQFKPKCEKNKNDKHPQLSPPNS